MARELRVEALATDGASGAVALRDGARRRVRRRQPPATRPGARTSGSSRPGTRSSSRRPFATSTRSRHALGRRGQDTRTTRSFRRLDTELVDAWFRLGFGLQHVHAIREAPVRSRSRSSPPGVVDPTGESRRHRCARQARPRSARPPGALTGLLPACRARARRRRGRSGTRTSTTPPSRPSSARSTGRVVGSAVALLRGAFELHSGLAQARPAPRILGFAAVLPEARGARRRHRARRDGASTGPRAEGYAAVIDDWRMTNLLSSRIWPKLGFRPTFFRLFRAIACAPVAARAGLLTRGTRAIAASGAAG